MSEDFKNLVAKTFDDLDQINQGNYNWKYSLMYGFNLTSGERLSEFFREGYEKRFKEKTGKSINDIDNGLLFTFIEHYGGEDCGVDYYSVYRISDEEGHEAYVKFQGWYQSYVGSEYREWYFVEPVDKFVTVYERI